MNPDSSSVPDNSSLNPDESANQVFLQAVEAERLGAWDEAISAYQNLLKKSPGNIRTHMALGKAYESKSRVGDERAFLFLAMEQYRLALRLNPQFLEANEALLSTAYRADSLDELLNEYRLRYKSDPNNMLFLDFVRKAETLISLPKKLPKRSVVPVGRFVHFLISRFLPAASVISFLLAWFISFRPRTPWVAIITELSLRLGFCLAVMYFVCWILITRA